MGVLVSFPIAYLSHEPGHAVADVEGHRLSQLGQSVPFGAFIGHIQGVGLGGKGEVYHRLGQMDRALRHPDEMTGLIGRHCQLQGSGVCQANVLAGKTGHPAGHIQRVLSSLQHPSQPIDSGVRVGVSHGLMQG